MPPRSVCMFSHTHPREARDWAGVDKGERYSEKEGEKGEKERGRWRERCAERKRDEDLYRTTELETRR